MKICNGVVGSVTLVTLLQLFPLPLPAAPRPPLWPPLPELVKVTYRASFDEVYFAGISNAVVTIPNYGTFRESWSGYSLERVGVVTPFVISGLGETGQVQVATAQGALRLWFRPYWGSGSGPGIAGRLAELAAVEGSQTAVLWSLQVSADGSALQLVGPGGNGVLLATEIDWAADSWHQLVLNYGTNGTELALDGEMVTKGDATLTVPASVVRLVIGSSFSGELPAGGELDEVVCFGRPLKAAFHYLPFASIAAMGPMSEAELAYRQELLAKWQALKAEKAKEAEESDSGGGMEMLRLGGPSANCVTNGPVYLTNVLANFTTNDGWTVYFDIAGGTNGVVYDIFSTPEFLGNDVTNSVWTWLETGMTCETHYYTNQPTNQVFYILTVPGADRDGDGLYDGWEWKHFGTLEQTASGDFDGDGVSNEDAHTSDDNPNNLRFSIVVTNNYVRTSALPVTLGMVTGKAETMAILVDSTNLQSAVWTTFITNCLVSIAATEGWHDVRFGLRGHCITNEVWRTLRVKYDVTPPVVVLTNPDLNGGNKPLIQLRGYGNELLGTIAYDISNAAGMTTNQVGWVTAQDYTTNGFSFATNHFQCYDVSLADGTNTFSLRISDLAGNTTTTNFAHVLDASGDVTPPLITLKWPQNGQALSGSNFAVNGLIDDPTVTMNAEVIDANGLTNKAAVSVGRSGMFWSEQLPLMAGTNQVHLVATDYKGNSSSTNILLTKSAVTLTVTQVSPEEPWQFRASVTGTIDTAGLDVWVNGTLASVNNGTWQAVSVPLNVNNMQVMLVQAYPTGSNPLTTPSTVELREMSDAPPSVKQTGWHLNTYNNATNYEIINLQQVWFHEITSVAENWTEGVGGEKSRYRWKQYLVSGNTFECTNYASLPTNMMGLVEGFPIQDTCNGATTTTLNPYLQHFEDVSGANFARVDAMTTLFANGQDIPGATRAVLLEVQAGIYGGDFKPEEVFVHGKPLSPSAEDPFVGQMLVMLPQGAALDAVPQVPSSANAFNYSIQSKEVKVILKSVTFSTNLSYQLFRDDVFSGFYPIPHWTPTNSSPVAFASGTRMEAQLDISITNIPTNTSLVFKGETGRGITFWGTNSVSGTNLSVTVIADYALATNKVDFFNPLTIQWSVTFPGETRFLNIGTSTNQIYVTLRAPSLDFYLLRHTLAHLACANPGATNDDQAVANTWSFFAGPANVKTWNGLPLTYYGTPSGGSNVTFLKLLERRDGQCYAFGELLYAAFKMNGITNAVWTSVRAPFELQGFGIKKIEFDTNNPAYPSEPIFKFAETNLNITIPDIPGQNTNPPQAKLFEEHIVLKRGGLFYDPSYGTTTTSATAYTTNVAAWKRSDERWRNADGSTNILLFIP